MDYEERITLLLEQLDLDDLTFQERTNIEEAIRLLESVKITQSRGR